MYYLPSILTLGSGSWQQRLTLFPRSKDLQTAKYTMGMDISSVDIHWDICFQHWLYFCLPLCFCIETFGFRGGGILPLHKAHQIISSAHPGSGQTRRKLANQPSDELNSVNLSD